VEEIACDIIVMMYWYFKTGEKEKSKEK